MMQPTALITGADRGLGFALAVDLLEQGWRVFAGQYLPEWPALSQLARQYPDLLQVVALDVSRMDSVQAAEQAVAAATDHLDVLINNAGVISDTAEHTIRQAQDYAEMHRLYDVNALGPLRVVEAFLPLLDRGQLKRLCFVSSEAGSIKRSRRIAWYGYCMSKAALNMAVKNLFNHLGPQGYIFRLYHPGWMRTYMSGQKNEAADMEPDDAAVFALAYFLSEQDEDELVLCDYQGQEWEW